MDEWPHFPLLPPDRRYIVRMERSRTRDPPRPPPAGLPLEVRPSPGSVAAGRVLDRSFYFSGWRDPRARDRPRSWAGWRLKVFRGRVPARWVPAVSVLVAVTLLPFGIIFCFACRPDLRGPRPRARQITPRDVRRILGPVGADPAFALRRFRV